MLLMITTVAWGTIVESKYNAEMAKIVVYDSTWFSIMLIGLWINIFSAALSRFPWKIHQLGFVTTHAGMLTLLVGGMITGKYGIDGTLAVTEGQAEDKVALSRLVIGVAPEGSANYQTVEVKRVLTEERDFSGLNQVFKHLLTVSSYIPFAEFSSTYESNAQSANVGLQFNLKSQFFNVSEFLHSSLNPRKQMGPATLELVTGDTSRMPDRKPSKQESKPAVKKPVTTSSVDIMDMKSGKVLQTVSVGKLSQGVRVGNVLVKVKTVFRNASVSANKLVDSPEPGNNPALELSVIEDGVEHREVLFARFPDFSMSKNPDRKLKFAYKAAGTDPAEAPPTGGEGGSNLVRFTVDPKNPEQALVELFKEGKPVLHQLARAGEVVQTPWMGMQLTIGSIVPGAEPKDSVKAIEAPQRENLPTGAMQIKLAGSDEQVWLPEGEVRTIQSSGRSYSVYFGRKIHRLPFRIELEKFSKKDYPGTETAMSFESDIKVTGDTATRTISMNEPMYRDGFTVYQSSYQINPNGPATSIFSINRDPGRPLTYLGSLILCLGIVTFVLMRSSYYRRWKGAP